MSFIPRKLFESRYEIGSKILDVQKFHGYIPSEIFIKQGKSKSFIDEGFFIKRREFKKKVWLESHDMYYFLTKYTPQFELSRILNKIDDSIAINSWNTFMSVTLFNMSRDSILRYKVSRLAYKFYRYARWIIRGLFILANVPLEKRDISVILDRY